MAAIWTPGWFSRDVRAANRIVLDKIIQEKKDEIAALTRKYEKDKQELDKALASLLYERLINNSKHKDA